ncbi:MAG: dihydroorotate dehydrogenase electron transfer subunit [Candidatus Bipolaricaulota bacterium]|nr:dihydroorotate dehydrogenase electron transfer subunit [Candidatus Bipolaricaulota bacterium]MBS3792084.1 dihydroorotate dehydrogenase electron transfer subunit [Candidatus Bipolaricaulota bacterium]
MGKDKIRIRKIESVKDETPTIKTFKVFDPPSAKSDPGQFLMVWVPGSGEIPLAVSAVHDDYIDLAVKRRGSTTKYFHELEENDKLGIRGPYGNGFKKPTEPSLLVGGGYGIAPLRFLHQKYAEQAQIHVVAGASTEQELLFLAELDPVAVSTEDGSRGIEGTVLAPMREVLSEVEVKTVYTSGPEKMVRGVYDICINKEVKLEASLERIMKCGVGLCGSCLIDGFRVCQDGPVVGLDQLKEFEEFGVWERSFSGRKERI